MPSRLRPTASVAADAILVGDPGRALTLAQELLEQPKMSNHARGLWGYTGLTPGGRGLTVQATGMGGPSAVLVLVDLAELGVRRAIRVGTCTGLNPELRPGQALVVTEAHAWGGPGMGGGAAMRPDPSLALGLRDQLGPEGHAGVVASLDTLHSGGATPPVEEGEVADMQTAALLDRAGSIGVAAAAVLIVVESATGDKLDDQGLELAAKRAGRASSAVLSA
jgi:uridine phosphorylase